MSDKKSVELRVSVDVGYRRHSVAIGLPSGEVLEEFEIAHRPEGFAEFFSRIEKHQKVRDWEVAVAMCAGKLKRKTIAGTWMIPPPMPRMLLRKPTKNESATPPIRLKR